MSQNPCIFSAAEFSPSLKALGLIKWMDANGHRHLFQLVNKVSTKWREFGVLLSLELDKLDGFDGHYRGNPTSCWNRVMEHWLNGGGGCDYPPTWEGLYTLLNDLELSAVAKEMENAVASYCQQ